MSAGVEGAEAGAGARTRAYRPVRRGGGDARLVGGVCAGLGRATDVDPIVYRVAVALLTVAGGVGVLVYAAGWLLMPAEDRAAAVLEERLGRRYTADDVLTILGAIVAAGFVLSLLGGPGNATLVSLVVLALGVLTAMRRGVDITQVVRNLPAHIRGRAHPAPGTAPGTVAGMGSRPGPGADATPDAGTGSGTGAAAAGIGAASAFPAETAMGIRRPVDADAGPATDPVPGPDSGAGRPAAAGTEPGGVPGRAGRPDGLIDLGAYGRGSSSAASGGPNAGDPYGPTIQFGPGAPGGADADGPYDLGAGRGAPTTVPVAYASRRGGGHWLGGVFFLAACGAGAWAMATAAPLHGWDGVVTYEYGAVAALLAIGIGLVVGAWFGRTRVLVFWGVLLSIALVALPMVGTGTGSVRDINTHWRPQTAAQASRPFHMGVGAGHLDLTGVPLKAKDPVRVSASLKAGVLRILVPHEARVRIDGEMRIGDIRGTDQVFPSRNGRVNTTLDPPGRAGKRTPVIDLHLNGLVGDVEVRRAA